MRRARSPAPPGRLEELPAAEEPLSRAFDRAWARAILKQAAALQAERAQARDERAVRRVEILRLRFHT